MRGRIVVSRPDVPAEVADHFPAHGAGLGAFMARPGSPASPVPVSRTPLTTLTTTLTTLTSLPTSLPALTALGLMVGTTVMAVVPGSVFVSCGHIRVYIS
jgi:hypothetical protein